MANINIDFTKTVGKIKPMHAVGQPPMLGISDSMFHYLTEIGAPYSRLHDVGGMYASYKWVDIPNIFRDFDADENDPASYDFAFTDIIINALIKAGVEPFFRLGVTIENYAAVKAYRIFPPKDFGKWARICEHIIRHYTEGWADGFNHKITYWEIWNEPDNGPTHEDNQMWWGTKEEFFELYDIASKHLKKCFPHLKIGGYASCGFYAISGRWIPEAKVSPRREYFNQFFIEFLEYIKNSGAPLDFFSWHTYDDVENNIHYAHYAREMLDKYGFTETETTCNEWLPVPKMRGTYHQAAHVAAVMLAFQNCPLDSAMIYDARCGVSNYSALFNPETAKPYPAYYAFTAFSRLYKLGNQVELSCDDEDVYAVAATDGKRGCLVISNHKSEAKPLEITANGDEVITLITAEGKLDSATPFPKEIPANSILTILYSL